MNILSLIVLHASGCADATSGGLDATGGTTASVSGGEATTGAGTTDATGRPSTGGSGGSTGGSGATTGTRSGGTTTGSGNGGTTTGATGTTAPTTGADASRGEAGAPDDAGAGTTGDATAAPDAGDASAPGDVPSATALQQAGPYTPTSSSGPSGYVLFHPTEIGKDGVKHPIVSWGPGAAENAASFTTLLNHLASWGFAVISYNATPQGQELVTAIDWMMEANESADSVFYQKLDTEKVAMGGHSAGSIATFDTAADPRLTTTLHISGGTFEPHTAIDNLHAPALFVCGEPPVDGLLIGDVARPNCDIDFENATVPVWYGVTKGASHMTPTEIGDPTLRSYQMAAMAGWLLWQLSGVTDLSAMFAGSSCALCVDVNWTVQQRGL